MVAPRRRSVRIQQSEAEKKQVQLSTQLSKNVEDEEDSATNQSMGVTQAEEEKGKQLKLVTPLKNEVDIEEDSESDEQDFNPSDIEEEAVSEMEDDDEELNDEALEDDDDYEEVEELEHIPLQIDSDSAEEDNEEDVPENVTSSSEKDNIESEDDVKEDKSQKIQDDVQVINNCDGQNIEEDDVEENSQIVLNLSDEQNVEEEKSETAQNDVQIAKKGTKRKIDENENAGEKKQKTDSQGPFSTLLLRNLPGGTTEATFNSFLNEKGVRCWASRPNFPRRKAFIDVSVSDEKAALELDKVTWKNCILSVQKSASKKETGCGNSPKKESLKSVDKSKGPNHPTKALLVSNLPNNTTYRELKNMFGNVQTVTMPQSKNGKPMGKALVEFIDVASASKVMNKANGHMLKESKLVFEYANPSQQNSNVDHGDKTHGAAKSNHTKRLFMTGVTTDVSRNELREYFQGSLFLRTFKDSDGRVHFSTGVILNSGRNPERPSFRGGRKDFRPKRKQGRPGVRDGSKK